MYKYGFDLSRELKLLGLPSLLLIPSLGLDTRPSPPSSGKVTLSLYTRGRPEGRGRGKARLL